MKMGSSSDGGDSPPFSALPPIITHNPREKIFPEEIDTNEIKISQRGQRERPIVEPIVPLEEAIPLHPLTITWSPEELYFEIKVDPVVRRLWVWNSGPRSIYIHCCDVWDEAAYLGARWGCYPQTRFLLAPGLKAEMCVRASPKDVAPVPCARPRLQLAAAHKRDAVIAHFAVPIDVRFLNHVPCVEEDGG